MKRPKCIGVCSTTSIEATVFCKGCGITDVEREAWGRFSHVAQLVTIEQCKYRVENYDECVVAFAPSGKAPYNS